MSVSFLDLDPIEEHIGYSVSQMTDDELFKYCELYHLMTFNHSLKNTPGMAIGRLRWLRREYQHQAGEILKWVWYRYDGLRDGEKFTFSWFSEKQTWYTHRLQGEMAGHRVELLKRMTTPDRLVGFMTAKTLSTLSASQIVTGGVEDPFTQERVPQRRTV